MVAHCLFEQSGTFKNEFKKLGIEAYDYDILNDYGETDYQVDLFGQIQKSYEGGYSIFDEFTSEDVVMAFFPCTMFQENNFLMFKGNQYQQRNMNNEQKLDFVIRRHKTLHDFYILLCKLMIVALRKNIKLIVENPYTQPHYLTLLFPVEPTLIDNDRMERGDCYKKPTQYWFLNTEPKNNIMFEIVDYKQQKVINHLKGSDKQRERSEIHPDYANRFIREFILDSNFGKENQ